MHIPDFIDIRFAPVQYEPCVLWRSNWSISLRSNLLVHVKLHRYYSYLQCCFTHSL